METFRRLFHTIKTIWMIILRKLGIIERPEYTYAPDTSYYDEEGQELSLWDEFQSNVINSEIDNIDDGSTTTSTPSKLTSKMIKMRAFTIVKDGKTIYRINTNITTIPMISTHEVQSINETELTYFQQRVGLITLVETPAGALRVTTRQTMETLSDETAAKFFAINPEVFIDRKTEENLTIYAQTFINRRANMFIKSKTRLVDYMVSTTVHSVANVYVTEKRKVSSQTALITAIIEANPDMIVIGSNVIAVKRPFVITSAIKLENTNYMIVVAHSLVGHNVVYNIEPFVGREI